MLGKTLAAAAEQQLLGCPGGEADAGSGPAIAGREFGWRDDSNEP